MSATPFELTFDQWNAARQRGEVGPGTNTGDGHAWPRPDGMQMRCGGPRHCVGCAIDAAMLAIATGNEATENDAPDQLESAFANLATASETLIVQLRKVAAIAAVNVAVVESGHWPSQGIFQLQERTSWKTEVEETSKQRGLGFER